MVEVTQEDWDAASRWMRKAKADGMIRRGHDNDLPTVQAFAAHRIAATSAKDKRIAELEADAIKLEHENERIWRERNIAYAKVKAWEAVLYVEGLPLRAVRVDEWGPGEAEQTTVPEVTPKRLVELLDRLADLERKALTP